MRHMSSSGPEPPSLFSDCSAASPRAAAAHGCSNWSVKIQLSSLKSSHRMRPCLTVFFVCVLQYAMFLTLVFLAELVAGVSGFIFRHEVSYSSKTLKVSHPSLKKQRRVPTWKLSTLLLCLGLPQKEF